MNLPGIPITEADQRRILDPRWIDGLTAAHTYGAWIHQRAQRLSDATDRETTKASQFRFVSPARHTRLNT